MSCFYWIVDGSGIERLGRGAGLRNVADGPRSFFLDSSLIRVGRESFFLYDYIRSAFASILIIIDKNRSKFIKKKNLYPPKNVKIERKIYFLLNRTANPDSLEPEKNVGDG